MYVVLVCWLAERLNQSERLIAVVVSTSLLLLSLLVFKTFLVWSSYHEE